MAFGSSGADRSTDRAISFQNKDLLNKPLDVSYFVNNICNLKCRHCYVGYEEGKGELSILEWTNVFDRLIDMGALTFGNVGKEPLLASEKTLSLLNYFAQKRKENHKLRFGFVTNGTLLKGKAVSEIAKISPDYIDVSLDGTIKEHDYIRGKGNYAKTLNNLRKLPSDLKQKIFISYTLMNHNKDSFENMIEEIKDMGIRKFCICLAHNSS
ncbi:MAG: radical SAM protein [Candidatus Aenigmarchaeota archaeon]|nr:radical SAM protein [Candidatus Aenigmarchaeota archaeon]